MQQRETIVFDISEESYEHAAKGERPFAVFYWVAADKDGNLALFNNEGFGLVPEKVFTSREMFLKALKTILYGDLSIDSTAVELLEEASYFEAYDEEMEISKRGIAFYDDPKTADWPYSLRSRPAKNLTTSNLPKDIKDYIENIGRANCLFAETLKVNAAEHWSCI